MSCDNSLEFSSRNSGLNPSSNGLRHIALQCQHVGQIAIVCLRPEVLVACTANQLCGDADATALTDYRSFDQSIDLQRFGDLRDRKLRVFEAHHGSARDDTEIVNC